MTMIDTQTAVRTEMSQVEYVQAASKAYGRNNYSEAQEFLVRALHRAKLSGQLNTEVINLAHTLAATYCLERRYEKAEKLYRLILETREKILGPTHPDIVDSLDRLAIVIAETQGKSAAIALAYRARCLDLGLLPPDAVITNGLSSSF